MAFRLPIFTFLWILTSALLSAVSYGEQETVARAIADPTVSTSRSEALLIAAVQTLERRDSIYAVIRQEVNLFGRHLVGSGSYLEQREGGKHRMRLELTLQIGDRTSSLVQVCDGDYLWTHRQLLGKAELSRIDVSRASEALARAEKMPGKGGMGILPGLGGLPKILRGLHASFDFTHAQQGRWGKRKRLVWRLRGQWKADRLLKILPNQKEAIAAGKPPELSELPQHLPDHVILLLGQEDLFPYRLEYRRAAGKKDSWADAPESRPLVTMQLYDVVLDGPVDRNRFIYNPGKAEFSDHTDGFVQSLGVKE